MLLGDSDRSCLEGEGEGAEVDREISFICFPHIHRGSVLVVAQQRNKTGNRKRYHQHTYPTLCYRAIATS